MNGPGANERQRSRLKALAMVSGWVAFSMLVGWGYSFSGNKGNAELSVLGTFDVTYSAGELIFCDRIGNLRVISILEAGRRYRPSPVARRSLTIPGIRFRSFSFADGRPVWSLRVSFLAPAALFGVSAFVRFWRLKKLGGRDSEVTAA
jgi:hypothetical protein